LRASDSGGDAEKKDAGTDSEDQGKGEKKAPVSADDLAATSDRIRETAKWLVATFGAVAGALIVGLQLSDIGDLEGADRVVASIAAAGALVAVIVIIALATLVLARGRVPLGELSSEGGKKYKRLREALNRNRSLYAGFESVSKLVDKVEAEWRKQFVSWSQAKDHSKSQTERQKAKKEFDETKEVLPDLKMLSSRLLASARAEDVRLTFEWVRNAVVVLAVLVAIAGVVFAFVDNAPDEEETSALPQRPVAARLHLDASGKEKLEPILGSDCDSKNVPVEVLSTSEEETSEVVSIPAEGCAAARLKIEPEDGEFTAVESAPLPVPTDPNDGGLDPPPAH
jgi:hypothetical protein